MTVFKAEIYIISGLNEYVNSYNVLIHVCLLDTL